MPPSRHDWPRAAWRQGLMASQGPERAPNSGARAARALVSLSCGRAHDPLRLSASSVLPSLQRRPFPQVLSRGVMIVLLHVGADTCFLTVSVVIL